jgi:hypothetical protein
MSEKPPIKSKPFADPADTRFYYDKALPFLNSTNHAKMGEFLKDVLVENCEAEREFYYALSYFLREVKSAEEPISVPAEDIQKLSSKLFDLRFLLKMIHATGLGAYADQIMELEIRKRWPVMGAGLSPAPAPKAARSPKE